MIHEVRVISSGINHKNNELLKEIKNALNINSIINIKTIKVYRFEGLNEQEVNTLAQSLLVELTHQKYAINKPIIFDAPNTVEIGFKPGVMNPEVASLFKSACDLNIDTLIAADTSFEYHFFGTLTEKQRDIITKRFLVNDIIEQIIKTPPKTLVISGSCCAIQQIPFCVMSKRELIDYADKKQLFLNENELCAIQNYFIAINRDPYDAEIETIAQTWSEHCYHKTFKAPLLINGNNKDPLFSRLKNTAQQFYHHVVSAFDDNAGVFRFYDGYAIAAKVETHNSPSAIEPYGGAATGSGGVFRDIMGTGLGAKVIASTDIFCFAPPDLKTEELPPGCLHPRYLLRRVVHGVRDYGNRMGIPTNNGSVHFHKDFRAKPTVIVGAYGIALEKKCQKGVPKFGDCILVVGGRTGRDGIHGATFSSGSMTSKTGTINASAVQIGNPIEEKRMADALLMCADNNLINAITDCGAGGFSSAIGEMAADIGAHVELKNAPLKYTGLAPWEIWISESQERMIVAISPKHVNNVVKICAEHNVEATEIGIFTNNKKLFVTYDGSPLCDLSMDFLHNGLPKQIKVGTYREKKYSEPVIPLPNNWHELYCTIMQHPNICSKEPIVRQYDHNIQGTNVLPPFSGIMHSGPNDATILTPLLGKKYGLLIGHGLNPILNRIDPYYGSLWAITEALANIISVGANPKEIALIDNFIWPTPDEISLGELDAALDACVTAMKTFEIPFISGKDSLSSTYQYPDGRLLKIPPVLCVSAIGKIPDVTKTVSADFKKNDSYILLIGTLDDKNMGGSAYLDVLEIENEQYKIPHVDINKAPKLFAQLHKHIKNGDILSCHDISEGGLAVTLAEMCFGGNCGATIDLTCVNNNRPDFTLFNETAGTFLVEVSSQKISSLKKNDTPHIILGKTTHEQIITIQDKNKTIINIPLAQLYQSWQKPMKEIF